MEFCRLRCYRKLPSSVPSILLAIGSLSSVTGPAAGRPPTPAHQDDGRRDLGWALEDVRRDVQQGGTAFDPTRAPPQFAALDCARPAASQLVERLHPLDGRGALLITLELLLALAHPDRCGDLFGLAARVRDGRDHVP